MKILQMHLNHPCYNMCILITHLLQRPIKTIFTITLIKDIEIAEHRYPKYNVTISKLCFSSSKMYF